MIRAIVFGVVAACTLFSALLVVSSKRLVHAVLWLAVVLAGTAALYVLLGAPFLAGIQILLYVGGVVTLMIFGVMLTRRGDERDVEDVPARRMRGLALSATLFGVVAAAIVKTPLPDSGGGEIDTAQLGQAIFGPYALAFEVLSVLLLATMVGAIVLARRRDDGAPAVALGGASARIASAPRAMDLAEPAAAAPPATAPATVTATATGTVTGTATGTATATVAATETATATEPATVTATATTPETAPAEKPAP